jgi:hypothetical protein
VSLSRSGWSGRTGLGLKSAAVEKKGSQPEGTGMHCVKVLEKAKVAVLPWPVRPSDLTGRVGLGDRGASPGQGLLHAARVQINYELR